MNKEAFLAFDRRVTERLRLASPRSLGWRAAAFLAHTGDSWTWAGGLAIVWLATADQANRFWHRTSAILLIAVVFQALFVFALKRHIRRDRPTGEWGGHYRLIDPHSFPSGHATRAMLLMVLAVGLGPPWFAALILLWGPLMAFSRVLLGVHYLSDVLGGLALGLVLGLIFLAAYPLLALGFPFLFS